MATRTLFLLLTVLALHGCGQMGPLYLPTEDTAQATPETPEPKDPDA